VGNLSKATDFMGLQIFAQAQQLNESNAESLHDLNWMAKRM